VGREERGERRGLPAAGRGEQKTSSHADLLYRKALPYKSLS